MSKKAKTNRTAPRAAKPGVSHATAMRLRAEIDVLRAQLAEAKLAEQRATEAKKLVVPETQALVPIELLEKIAGDLNVAISTGTQLAAITSSAAATHQNDAALGHVGLTRFFNHHFGANADSHHVARNALTLVGNAQFLAARIRAVIPARAATLATDECASDVRRAA